MNTCLTRSIRLLAATAVFALVALPAMAQYNYFPGGAAVNDGRTVALAGDNIETLAQDSLTFIVAVPPGVTQFELGIFDGETGQADGNGQKHWDNGSTQLQYALFYDPYMQGTSDPANLVGMWRGNETNATSGATWVASSATFPDNDWWNLTVDVPEPPDPLPGQAPSGATFYHLCVSYRGQTGAVTDPCTGDARPADAAPSTIGNFKIRATANISVLSFAFAYEAALRPSGNQDVFIIYPQFDGTLPTPDFFLTTPTTYDGTWSFDIDVPQSQEEVVLFGGDFDFGTAQTTAFPSGVTVPACVDTDDPDTPNSTLFPPFAVDSGGARLDDSLAEGARTSGGVPADDNYLDVFRRSPCIRWTLTSPGADGDIATPGDNVTYANDNPSSQREWEQFRISSSATCDASATCDPNSADCADFCENDVLPAGTWRIAIQGVDLFNLNAWRSTNLAGFCIGCAQLPRPYLVGDTVFEDADGNGTQDSGEAGIPGVLMELLDANGRVMDTRLTGDPGSYGPGEWDACVAHNTGVDTPLDTDGLYCFDVAVPDADPNGVDTAAYTVRVAASNFTAGGALFDYFGGEPTASLPSPEQSDVVTEGGGNVMTYDFGYFVEAQLGSLGDRVWLDSDGDGVQDGGEVGINGVTVNLYDGDGNLIASQVTSGDGEYLFTDLPEGTYTVQVDASTLPGSLAQTYDLDGLATPHEATLDLGAGEERLDVDFGYTPCSECDGKVTLLRFVYHGDETVFVKVKGKKGRKTTYLFHGMVAPGEEFEVVGTWDNHFGGTLGTEIRIYVDYQEVERIHTSCSQPIGPGQVYGDFEIVYGESKNGGALCSVSCDNCGGGGGCDDGGGDGSPGTGTIGYWKNHPEAWPVDELLIGDHVYSKNILLWALQQPVRGDITVALAQQLIAAKLNVESGNESSCIDDVIAAADDYLAQKPWGCNPKGSSKSEGEALKDALDSYNNGQMCAPHRG